MKGSRATEVLGLVHTYVCGPVLHTSWQGARYFKTFIDDKTKKTFVYFLNGKNEVMSKFKEFKSLVENQTGYKIKVLRSDNGKEYVNTNMEVFLKQCGIWHQLTAAYTPQQNGVAERANRPIVERARAMLEEDQVWTKDAEQR